MKLLNVLLFFILFIACNSSDEPNAVEENTLTLNITYPSSTVSPILNVAMVGGTCGRAGYPIKITGSVDLFTVCQPNFRWYAPIKVDGMPDGNINIEAEIWEKDYSLGSGKQLITLVKQTTDCSNTTNLSKVFANIDTADGNNTPYQICNASQFFNISDYPTKKFQLGDHIDFSSISNASIVGVFEGELDGQGYTLKNININESAGTGVGLFRTIRNATIENLNIQNINLTGNIRVGALTGDWQGNGILRNVKIKSTTSGVEYIGGVIGLANSAPDGTGSGLLIQNVEVQTTVNGNNFVGGLIGYINTANNSLNIENSTVYADVSGLNHVGGMIGRSLESTGVISSSHHKGSISSLGLYTGGLVGEAWGISISNSSHVGSINSQKDAVSTYVGGLVGWINRFPGAISDSHVVSNISSGGNYTGGLVGRHFSGPIDNSYTRGAITVQDDYYNSSLQFVGGLVGNINLDSSISNSHSAINITAQARYVGGLVGFFNGATSSIDNSYNLGTISITGHDSARSSFVGGLVSYFHGNSITNSYNEGDIFVDFPTPSGTGTNIGGIVGYSQTSGANFNKVYNKGNISVTNGSGDNVGGIAGFIRNLDLSEAFNTGDIFGARQIVGGIIGKGLLVNLNESFSSGDISGELRHIGGIVGYAIYTNITDAFSSGEIKGQADVGGIVGNVLSDGTSTVLNTYSLSNVKKLIGSSFTNDFLGPIIGTNATGTFQNNFYPDTFLGYDENTSSDFTDFESTGNPLAPALLGLETSYTGFDFSNIWQMPSGGFSLPNDGNTYSYPILQFLSEPNFGNFSLAATYNDDPINEGVPNILPDFDDYITYGESNEADVISSSSAPESITEGNLELTISSPLNGENITGNFLVHGECGIPGNIIGISGDFSNYTICQNNYRWAIVLDSLTTANSSVTLSANLFNQAQTASSSLVTRSLNRVDSVCNDEESINGTYGNSHLSPDGSVSNPYIICNGIQFGNIALNPSSNFELGTNINFQGNSPNEILIPFTGSLDGKNFKVSNFSIVKPSESDVALFKILNNATIKNIKFEYFYVKGYSRSAVLAGQIQGQTDLENIDFNGTVEGVIYTGLVAGIANSSANLNLSQITSNSNITGNDYTAGLIGQISSNDGGFNASDLTLENTIQGLNYVGGIVGSTIEGNTTLDNINLSGTIGSYKRYLGGLFGYSRSFNLSNTSVTAALTSSQMTGEGDVGGIAGYAAGTVILTNSHYDGTLNAGSGFVGGLLGRVYQGTLNNVYSSGNLNVAETKYNSVTERVGGLIGSNDFILSLDSSYSTMNIDVTSRYVGGLIGDFKNDTSSIDNSYFSGSISARTSHVGGLVGTMDALNISNSYADAIIDITNPTPSSYIGGFVGYSESFSADFDDNYSQGSITINNGIADYVGGHVGYFKGGTISNSYAKVDLNNVRNSSGGFVGLLYGDIDKSYSEGNVNANLRYNGGFVGFFANGLITDSFSIGDVEAYEKSGGFVGYAVGASNSIKDVYASGSIVKLSGSTGDDLSFGPVAGELDDNNIVSNAIYINENKDPLHNSIGIGINNADINDINSYQGFDFNSDLGWRISPNSYTLPSGESYIGVVLRWMIPGVLNTYTVSGSVSGIDHDEAKISLNNQEELTFTSSDSSFTFATSLEDGQGYDIQITGNPNTPSVTCVISNNVGVISGADITNVSLVCPSLQSITLNASNTIIANGFTGETVTASANFSDSTIADITNQVSWSYTPSGIVSIDNAGAITTLSNGVTQAEANLFSITQSISLTVTSAPFPASNVSWSNPSPFNGSSIEATWNFSSSGSLDSQKVYFYQTNNCSGTVILETGTLSSSLTSFSYTNALDGESYSFKVGSLDSSGNESLSACSNVVIIDTSGPNAPQNISLAMNWTNTDPATSPSFTWENPTTDFSSVEVALGTSIGGNEVSGWTDLGALTTHQFSSITLTECTTYYPSVKALDALSNESSVSTDTNGFQWDITAPVVDSVSFSFSEDSDSDKSPTMTLNNLSDNCFIGNIEVSIGTTPSSTDTLDWVSIGTNTTYQLQDGVDGSFSIDDFTSYHINLRVTDGAGNISSIISSQPWQYYPYDPSVLLGAAMWFDGNDNSTTFSNAGCTQVALNHGESIACWKDKIQSKSALSVDFQVLPYGTGATAVASSEFSGTYAATNAIDGTKTGGYEHNWFSANGQTDGRLNIQVSSALGFVADGIRINNSHGNGTALGGIKNFEVYGSNEINDFNDTNMNNITSTMDLLGSFSANAHGGGNIEDDQDFFFSTNGSYIYYILRITSVYAPYASVGEVEFLEMTSSTSITVNKVNDVNRPVVSFDGSASFKFDSTDLNVGSIYIVKKSDQINGVLLGNSNSDVNNIFMSNYSNTDELYLRKGSTSPDGFSLALDNTSWQIINFDMKASSGQYEAVINPSGVSGKSNSEYSATYDGSKALNNIKTGYGWVTKAGENSNNKLNLDYNIAFKAKGIRLTNGHFNNGLTSVGVNNFEIYGSNELSDYDNLTYGDITGTMTLLGSFSAAEFTTAQPEGEEFLFTANEIPFQYYIIRGQDNHGQGSYMSIHEVELILEKSGEVAFFENGVDQSDTGSSTVNDSQPLTVNSIGGAQSQFLNGEIGEVIIFDRELNTSEKADVLNYLQAKWQ